MKHLFIALTFTSFSFVSFGQNVGVNVEGVDGSQNTTIEIKKGTQPTTTTNQFEITSGEDEIQGDGAPLLKEARKNWKKACSDWKEELKDLNKENKILSMPCGTPSCATQAMETVCTSKATYKIRVKTN